MVLINTQLGDHVVVKQTRTFLQTLPVTSETHDKEEGEEEMGVVWERAGEDVCLVHREPVLQVCCHGKGDYLASVTAGQCKLLLCQGSIPVSFAVSE